MIEGGHRFAVVGVESIDLMSRQRPVFSTGQIRQVLTDHRLQVLAVGRKKGRRRLAPAESLPLVMDDREEIPHADSLKQTKVEERFVASGNEQVDPQKFVLHVFAVLAVNKDFRHNLETSLGRQCARPGEQGREALNIGHCMSDPRAV